MNRNSTVIITAVGYVLSALATPPPLTASGGGRVGANNHWVATWSTALVQPSPGAQMTNAGFSDQTLRQIVHTSVGGSRVRVRLSTFGAGRLAIGSAHIALQDTDSAIVPGSDRVLTFSNETSPTIAAGAVALSDSVDLEVPALSNLAISIFVSGSSGPATWHFAASQNTYVSLPGDFTGSVVMPVESTQQAWFWLAGVEVLTSTRTGAVVTFGDSITDGVGSTPNQNNRWPDYLAQRLQSQQGNHNLGVLNQGLAGNKVVLDVIGPNAQSRFDRDVLTQTGVTHIIVAHGNNDFLFVFSPSEDMQPGQVIAGHKQLIHRAHALGLTVYGATLTPFGGFALSTPDKEARRQVVNQWIRTAGAFDAVIDFDAVVRDPGEPTRLLPAFDSGDHLHPNDAGYRAMADAIDLKLFKDREK